MAEPSVTAKPQLAPGRQALLAILIAAIFLSAALLFAIEPMFTKMVLPRLGGSPSVWSVAMVFFQTMLLAGYAYAHLLTRYAPGRASVFIHVAILLLAVFSLPPAIAAAAGRPPESGEAFWLMGLFAASIGLPFFALAANAPLLQAWFARTDHPAAADPYFLYAASNVGSFLALLSYPSLIEPLIPLGGQTRLWSVAFGLLIVLIAAAGAVWWRLASLSPVIRAPDWGRGLAQAGIQFFLSKSRWVPALKGVYARRSLSSGRPKAGPVGGLCVGTSGDSPATGNSAACSHAEEDRAPVPTWRDGIIWGALAAVPAGLLVAVTAHISTDVAAVPLLWVLPLALYLLTFVIVFQRRPFLPHALALDVQPLLILALVAVIIFDPVKTIIGVVAVHCMVFFVNALVCHGELARRRPAARHLTVFYLWMSAGGMIGGLSAGLIAPYVFNWVAEYPILIALAALCRPGLASPADHRGRALLLGALAISALALVVFTTAAPDFDELTFNWIVGALLLAGALVWAALLGGIIATPLPFAAIVAAALWINHSYADSKGTISVRSFFGVHKVAESADGRFRILSHGTTIHGAERIRDDSGNPLTARPAPLTYYYDGSGMAQVMDMVRARIAGPIRYAVIGLGTGSLACRARPGDTVRFYEIDPAIVYTARDSGLFHFLSACTPDVPIVLGDARLTLADAPDGSYDVIYVDAFSSDAIPIHLITREAMAIYLRKLAPHGVAVIHISNRYLELASVVGGIAAANGALARVNDGADVQEKPNDYLFVGTVVAVARSEEDFGPLAQSQYWPLQEPDPGQWVWTDDYSNVLGAVIRQLRSE
jgi:hypothetical protein